MQRVWRLIQNTGAFDLKAWAPVLNSLTQGSDRSCLCYTARSDLLLYRQQAAQATGCTGRLTQGVGGGEATGCTGKLA